MNQVVEGARLFIHMPFSGKTEAQRIRIALVARVAEEVCLEAGINAHLPWRNGVDDPGIPPRQLYIEDKEALASAHLLLAMADSSAGLGGNVHVASDSLVPVIYLVGDGTEIPASVEGSGVRCLGYVRFSDPDSLRTPLAGKLREVRQLILLRANAVFWNSGKEYLGRMISDARNRAGMTRADLARRVHCAEHLIEWIETKPAAVSNPSYRQMQALSYVLDIPIETLVTGKRVSASARRDSLTSRHFAANDYPHDHFVRFVEHMERNKPDFLATLEDRQVEALYRAWLATQQ